MIWGRTWKDIREFDVLDAFFLTDEPASPLVATVAQSAWRNSVSVTAWALSKARRRTENDLADLETRFSEANYN